MLGRGELKCSGAISLSEYMKYTEKDPTVEHRFEHVLCGQPSVEDTISILNGLRDRYELHHGMKISDNALISEVILPDRYITERFLPEKGIDLVDEIAAKLKMEITSKPTELDEVDRVVLKLEMEKLYLKNDTALASKVRSIKLERDLGALKQKQRLTKLTLRWKLMEATEHEYNLNRVVELKYGMLMTLERQLQEVEKSLANYRISGKSLIREEVTNLGIVEIVSRRTSIPLSNLHQPRGKTCLVRGRHPQKGCWPRHGIEVHS